MNPYAVKPIDSDKEELLSNAMKRNWQHVIDTYKNNTTAHKAKISASGDTALHLAISDEQEDIVQRLVDKVDASALAIQNDLGNTPLHLAAYVGNAKMCYWIASKHSELIGKRNKGDETPLFLAVVHGRRDAFLCLHSLCEGNENYDQYCRRNDGRTILHSAIAGEHFDLAFQIIHLNEKLVHSVDERGFTPLHVLAGKPSAFRSGCYINIFRKLIYQCVHVSKLEVRENLKTSLGLHHWLRNIIRTPNAQRVQKTDAENPNSHQIVHENAMVPGNYSTCFLGLKSICKVMGVIFGLDSVVKGKIREEKEKHTWSVQIMEVLLECLSTHKHYKYGGAGSSQHEKDGEMKTVPYTLRKHGIHDFSPDHLTLTELPMVRDDHSRQQGGSNSATTIGNGQKDKAPPVTKEGIKEMVEKILANFGVGTNKDENKDERENEKKEKKEERENEKKESASLTAAKHGIIELMAEKIFENFKSDDDDQKKKAMKNESALLIAAKYGITEMVDKILETFPMAIHDKNSDGKNIVLLAVENRQPHVYQYLLEHIMLKEAVFYKTDKDGNSALHLAAMLGNRKSWLLPGPALQMQWEVKWYQFVEKSMPPKFFVRYNFNGETPWDIFSKTHESLVEQASEWLNKTSQSCSIVAVLIATVAFTTSATVPGGVNSASGRPVLSSQPAFNVFAMASLVALCFSIASVVMFMVFFTSRYREKDFGTDLPTKLLVELTSLLVAIAAVLVSFCAGHFFVIRDSFRYTALSLYAATLFPVAIYAFWQIPVYTQYAKATWQKVPQRIYEHH